MLVQKKCGNLLNAPDILAEVTLSVFFLGLFSSSTDVFNVFFFH